MARFVSVSVMRMSGELMRWCGCVGYGATTLPALTEAFTIEHNATLADHEVRRLKKLVHRLAKEIKP